MEDLRRHRSVLAPGGAIAGRFRRLGGGETGSSLGLRIVGVTDRPVVNA